MGHVERRPPDQADNADGSGLDVAGREPFGATETVALAGAG